MSPRKANMNKEIVALISNLCGQSSTLTVPKMYVELTGSHSRGMVLAQCIFWSNKSKNNDGWFFKPYTDWQEELHMSERSMRRHFEKLEEAGYITTKVKKVGGLNIKHVFTHTSKIIESLRHLAVKNLPNQTYGDDGTEDAQESSPEMGPIEQSGRFEGDTLAGSTIYRRIHTDTKDSETKSETPSSSFFLPKK